MPGMTKSIADAFATLRAEKPTPEPAPEKPVKPHRPKRLPPLARVDALARVPFFAARSPMVRVIANLGDLDKDSLRTDLTRIGETRGRPAARGWRDCMSRFTALGLVVIEVPNADPPKCTLASPGGRAPEGLVEVFGVVADWIAAGLAGKPWPCAWCATEAITILVGGIPACSAHQS
jgi:hypothetical protein